MECIIKENVLFVPEGTIQIGFKDICNYIYNHTIEEVVLPTTLKVIEDDTFFDFNQLIRINIPENVIEIGSQAFFGLDLLEELLIPSTVSCVKKHAFCNLLQCRLVITGKHSTVPDGWDTEFAANVKEICWRGNYD
jgi:hypothetical protein